MDGHHPLALRSLSTVGEFGVLAAVADLLDAVWGGRGGMESQFVIIWPLVCNCCSSLSSLNLKLTSSLSDDPSGHVVGDDAGHLPEALGIVLGNLEEEKLLSSIHGGGGVGDDGDEAEVGSRVEGLIGVGHADGGVCLPLKAAAGGSSTAQNATDEFVRDEKDEFVVELIVVGLVHGVDLSSEKGGGKKGGGKKGGGKVVGKEERVSMMYWA